MGHPSMVSRFASRFYVRLDLCTKRIWHNVSILNGSCIPATLCAIADAPCLDVSDIDLEKPWFPNATAASAKEPLVLSPPGAESIIQVTLALGRVLRDSVV